LGNNVLYDPPSFSLKVIDRAASKRLSIFSCIILKGGQLAFLRVPARYRDGIAILAALNNTSFSEVYTALKNAPTELPTYAELATKVEGEIKALNAGDVAKLIGMLTSLYRVRDRSNISPEKMADDLYDAIQKEGGSLVPQQNAAEFKSRLAQFLNLGSLNVVATKAQELQSDVERAFCDARILTDLRPVFGNEISGGPTAMIIVHTLKLRYHEGAKGELKEMYFGIDSDDIAKLKQVLERAEIKAKSLVSRLQDAGIKSADLG
jgi:hypothetical protein